VCSIWICHLDGRLDFGAAYGLNEEHVLPPIRVTKSEVNQELRNVDLKLTLTNKIISRKIVISKVETLYVRVVGLI